MEGVAERWAAPPVSFAVSSLQGGEPKRTPLGPPLLVQVRSETRWESRAAEGLKECKKILKKDIKGRRAPSSTFQEPSRSIESGRKQERRVPWRIGLISFDGTGLDGDGDAPPHASPPVEQQA